MRTYFLIFITLTLAPMHALSETGLKTVNLLSKSVLTEMKLNIYQLQDEVPFGVSNCIQNLDNSSFDNVVAKLVSDNLSKDELQTAEKFFATAVGEKYKIYILRNIYKAARLGFPTKLPNITETEYKQMVSFSTTSVGAKLKRNEVLIPNNTIKNRMIELSKGCGADVST